MTFTASNLMQRWRQAATALLAGAATATLLVACGGGGDSPATAQSVTIGPIGGLGSILGSIFGVDQESIDVIQEITGYLLTLDTRQQKAFLIIGPPRSGKGRRWWRRWR